MSEPVVSFKNVTKRYKLYKNDRARFLSLFSNHVRYKENKAVNNMSFEINKGEAVAFIGEKWRRKIHYT